MAILVCCNRALEIGLGLMDHCRGAKLSTTAKIYPIHHFHSHSFILYCLYGSNYTFTGGGGWLVGLSNNKANLSPAYLKLS